MVSPVLVDLRNVYRTDDMLAKGLSMRASGVRNLLRRNRRRRNRAYRFRLLEIGNGSLEPVFGSPAGLPPQNLLRARDIGLALLWIVDRKRSENSSLIWIASAGSPYWLVPGS